MKSIGNGYEQKLSDTPPVTTDLPATGSTAYEIDLTGDMTANVSIRVGGEAHATSAISATQAATNFSDGNYFVLDEGRHNFGCAGNHNLKLYVKSASSAITGGLSVWFSDFA